MKNQNMVKDKSFSFALSIIKYYKYLCYNRKEYVLSRQMLRSGTSIGANIYEAQKAQTTADFIHKMTIAQKECAETEYWLSLLINSDYSDNTSAQVLKECENLLNIISRILITTKRNNKLM